MKILFLEIIFLHVPFLERRPQMVKLQNQILYLEDLLVIVMAISRFAHIKLLKKLSSTAPSLHAGKLIYKCA